MNLMICNVEDDKDNLISQDEEEDHDVFDHLHNHSHKQPGLAKENINNDTTDDITDDTTDEEAADDTTDEETTDDTTDD